LAKTDMYINTCTQRSWN